jgi:hypothetical protein
MVWRCGLGTAGPAQEESFCSGLFLKLKLHHASVSMARALPLTSHVLCTCGLSSVPFHGWERQIPWFFFNSWAIPQYVNKRSSFSFLFFFSLLSFWKDSFFCPSIEFFFITYFLQLHFQCYPKSPPLPPPLPYPPIPIFIFFIHLSSLFPVSGCYE